MIWIGRSRLESGGWRLEAEGWRLEAEGWRFKQRRIAVVPLSDSARERILRDLLSGLTG